MKNGKLEKKLERLKELIKQMNIETVQLINSTAIIEAGVRKLNGGADAEQFEKEIDGLIYRYENVLKNTKLKPES